MTSEKRIKRQLVKVSNFRNKNEKASFIRKKKNLETLVAELNPINEQIFDLTSEKDSKMNEVKLMHERLTILAKDINDINNSVYDLIIEKTPIEDKINDIREEMMKDCVHPIDYLVHNGSSITCRFCETRLKLVDNEKI